MKKLKDIRNVNLERAVLVQAILGRISNEEAADSLEELERLSDTAGALVVARVTQKRDRPTPNYFVGEGKLEDIKRACEEANANMVIFDNELTPVQVNNLDVGIGVKVIDRTELILQIFARRARSAEAQIQVELAQLQYLVSRLPSSEKQARFKGGIGMKGPGESPLQLRNEPMRRRIKDLKEKLKTIQERRQRTREHQKWPMVCLVGYTNAGKSTLLNAFSAADAYVDDRLFATLDTKTRLVRLPDGSDILMADTVGFIRHLPHGLVASFRSTLEVASKADLLLIVADSGHPRFEDHLRVVHETLKEIEAEAVQSLLVLNKCDSPEGAANCARLKNEFPEAISISAKQKDGLDKLQQAIQERLMHAVHRRDTHRQSR